MSDDIEYMVCELCTMVERSMAWRVDVPKHMNCFVCDSCHDAVRRAEAYPLSPSTPTGGR